MGTRNEQGPMPIDAAHVTGPSAGAIVPAAVLRPLLVRLAHPLLLHLQWRRNRRKAVHAPVELARESKDTRSERILLLTWFDPTGLKTIRDNVDHLGWYSGYRWFEMNLFGWETRRGLVPPPSVRFEDYDAVFVHCTASFDADNLETLVPALARYGGLKVMHKQDEHYRTSRIVRAVKDAGFHLLLTCVPPDEVRKVYPESELPRLRIFHALTGYVTDQMRGFAYPFDGRPIDIGYRGSPQPFHYGRLAWEKRQIAEVFKPICQERGLTHDIAFGMRDRIFGNGWFDFLGRSKGTLGSESGGSVFDFDGEVEKRSRAYLRRHPGASFEEVEAAVLAPYEGNVRYAQVAPRHFEAAACGTAQILYEGRYSGIFEADRHYFSLKRNLSNLDEVLARFLDPVERKRVVDAAREEIVGDDRHHYRGFVRRLDEAIEAAFAGRGV